MIGAKGFYKLTVIKTLVSGRWMGLIFEKLTCRNTSIMYEMVYIHVFQLFLAI